MIVKTAMSERHESSFKAHSSSFIWLWSNSQMIYGCQKPPIYFIISDIIVEQFFLNVYFSHMEFDLTVKKVVKKK